METRLNGVATPTQGVASFRWVQFTRHHHLSRLIAIGTTLTAILCLSMASPSEAGTHKTYRVTYTYSCCSWKLVHTVYRPGDRLTIHWLPMADSSPPNERLRLSAWIVGPFRTADLLKDDTESPRPESGLIKVNSIAVTLSNNSPLHPVSVIHIPRGSKSGYYDLWTKIVWFDGGSGTGASVIRISK